LSCNSAHGEDGAEGFKDFHGGGLLLGGRILRALASMAPWAGYQRGGTTNIDGLACAIRAGE